MTDSLPRTYLSGDASAEILTGRKEGSPSRRPVWQFARPSGFSRQGLIYEVALLVGNIYHIAIETTAEALLCRMHVSQIHLKEA